MRLQSKTNKTRSVPELCEAWVPTYRQHDYCRRPGSIGGNTAPQWRHRRSLDRRQWRRHQCARADIELGWRHQGRLRIHAEYDAVRRSVRRGADRARQRRLCGRLDEQRRLAIQSHTSVPRTLGGRALTANLASNSDDFDVLFTENVHVIDRKIIGLPPVWAMLNTEAGENNLLKFSGSDSEILNNRAEDVTYAFKDYVSPFLP